MLFSYSHRDLSFENDIFPALSGLARAFQREYADGDVYLAGLWQKDILRGLLWMIKDSSLTSRPLKYRSPSWSWASVKGQVDWPSRTIARHCHNNFSVKFVDAQMNTTSGDPMLAITSGTLRLLGKFLQLTKVVKPQELGTLLRFPYDLLLDDDLIGNGIFDVNSEVQSNDIWILQIELQGPGDSFFPYHPSSLLLRKVGSETSVFSRVGYASLNEDYVGLFDDSKPQEICLI